MEESVVIRSVEDLPLIDEVRKGPRLLVVKRELFDIVESVLKKRMVVTSVEKISSEYISFRAAYPEHLCNLHRDILVKSQRLANPEVISLLFKVSQFLSRARVKDPFELASTLNVTCRYGYRFLYLVPEPVPSRAFIICGGVTGSILAVVLVDVETEIGVRALRHLFHRIPVEIYSFSIRTELLRKT